MVKKITKASGSAPDHAEIALVVVVVTPSATSVHHLNFFFYYFERDKVVTLALFITRLTHNNNELLS